MDVSRQELDTVIHRVEDGQRRDRDEILEAIRDLKISMNGQFAAQGAIIARHDREVAVLQDRDTRDVPARWAAAIGTLLALLSSYLGLKG